MTQETSKHIADLNAQSNALTVNWMDFALTKLRLHMPKERRISDSRVRWPERQQTAYSRLGYQIDRDGKQFHNGMLCEIDPTLADDELIIENGEHSVRIFNLATSP